MQFAKRSVILIFLFVSIASIKCYSGDKGTINVGVLYNGLLMSDYTSGVGTSLGFEYRPTVLKNISVSLRYKYVYYHFDDGAKQTIGDDGTMNPYNRIPRLSFNLHTQQIGIVPKFYYELMDGVDLFIENEFNYVAVTGDVRYLLGVNEKRKISGNIPFSYSAIIGFEIKDKRLNYGLSVGYTTLSFRDEIARNKPINYRGSIPSLDTGILINFYFKIPLLK